ncbi:rhomboid family intramembrane serine protease [Altererythrobacter sp. KTW20L]|uniref:rhomboid family intramembrane serine protease n=1 Tax=Altererythrobacter sp. KTW20L TaxID=2942210 RepID=UPI0020BFD082|nr:rhomboid family intramembrane serine protease [Altererythrobacter sp. KTW20L]
MPEEEQKPQVTVSVPRTAPGRMHLPKAVHIPAAVLLALIWAAWLSHLPTGDMREWGISALALEQGRYDTIVLNMFAHAGLLHIGMNSAVLLGFAGPLVWAMGASFGDWTGGSLRFFAFYFLSGLAGAAMFVGLNPDGAIPAVGASGAISGMIGYVSRVGSKGRLLPLFSRELGRRIWQFAKANLILIAIFAVPFFLGGTGIMIAWEAHLGGFLFGLVAAGLFDGGRRG